jgi:hypothetical protein
VDSALRIPPPQIPPPQIPPVLACGESDWLCAKARTKLCQLLTGIPCPGKEKEEEKEETSDESEEEPTQVPAPDSDSNSDSDEERMDAIDAEWD